MRFSMRILLTFVMSLAVLPACERSENFLQPVPPPPPRYSKIYQMSVNTSERAAQEVDILWVIDNSGSMGEEQGAVISNSAQFMQTFTSTTSMHWRMGLISTAFGETPYLGFNPPVDWTTVDAVGQFNAAVGRMGLNGIGPEQTFAPVLKTLNDYPSFLRPGAFFIMIVVSDEPEQSSVTTQQFIDDISRRMGGSRRFAAFAVIDPTLYGNETYKDLVRLTNGKSYDIRSSNYGILLAELGKDLVQRVMSVNPVILLDQRPKIETIRVAYKGRVLKGGMPADGGMWSYDPNFNLIRIHNANILDASDLNVDVSFELAEEVLQ